MNISIIDKKILIIGGLLAVIIIFVAFSVGTSKNDYSSAELKFPPRVMLQDFQSPNDNITGEITKTFENTVLSQLADDTLIRPLLDDSQTIMYCYSAVEITNRQFSGRQSLNQIVNDCARIMGIKRPRVFIQAGGGMNAFTVNVADPIVVLSDTIVSSCTDDELRFVIGHEFGHIKCSHVRMLTILKAAQAVLPENILTSSLILPYLKLCREAEYSADNAGLLCCQNLDAAEQVLLRLLCGLGEQHVGKINVDEFLAQVDEHEFSKAASVVQWGRSVLMTHPFIPSRIKAIQKYAKEYRYHALLERQE